MALYKCEGDDAQRSVYLFNSSVKSNMQQSNKQASGYLNHRGIRRLLS